MNTHKLWVFFLICSILVFSIEHSFLFAQGDAEASSEDTIADPDTTKPEPPQEELSNPTIADPETPLEASTESVNRTTDPDTDIIAPTISEPETPTDSFTKEATDLPVNNAEFPVNNSEFPEDSAFPEDGSFPEDSSLLNENAEATWYDELEKGLYARIDFDTVVITVNLYYQKYPTSVSYFVGLATGQITNNAISNSDEKESVGFYDNSPVLKHIPGFLLYVNANENSPEEYINYSFKNENYFSNYIFDDNGFLALTSSSNIESSSELLFIFDTLESYPLTPTVIGKFVQGNEDIQKAAMIQTLRSINIMAVGQNAQTFLKNLDYAKLPAKFESIDEKFYITREKNINNTIQSLVRANHSKTVNDIFFTFSEGNISSNLNSIEHPTLSRVDLLNYLEGPNLDITLLSNRRIESEENIYIYYRSSNFNTKNEFYNNYTNDSPIAYTKLRNESIEGIQRLLKIMSPGQTLTAYIPPDLAYKEDGFGPLVRSSDFLEVELTMFTLQDEDQE